MKPILLDLLLVIVFLLTSVSGPVLTACAQVVVRGKMVYTMAGPPIENGSVVVRNGKIASVGKSADIQVPEGFALVEAAVVTPGLVDAHSTVGLTGMLNQRQDQDQLERSVPIQPALRALDAYNAHDELIEWIRGFGITTIHTGHAPGELISGQTMVVKTTGNTVAAAVLVETRAVAVTLSSAARKSAEKSPGTRAKMISLLRQQLLAAQEYHRKRSSPATDAPEKANGDKDKGPLPRDLSLEVLADVLEGKFPMLVTAHRAQDISNALRLATEFGFKLWLDGAAESYLLIEEIKQAGIPVIIHPTMARATGDLQNLSFETAATLSAAQIPLAIQSGYEAYVPKTRVVLFEAGLAAANGLGFERALAAITIDAATILGVADRVGSLEVDKDGDLALYDGDPFEYTTHCIGTIIAGKVVHQESR